MTLQKYVNAFIFQLIKSHTVQINEVQISIRYTLLTYRLAGQQNGKLIITVLVFIIIPVIWLSRLISNVPLHYGVS